MQVKEIERRFLLKRIPIVNWTNIYDIVQYYIHDTELGVVKRLRVKYDVLHGMPRTFEYLHKVYVAAGQFVEVHEDFNPSDFKEIRSKAFKSVSKRRYVYDHQNLKFEVDDIDGVSLVIMEVELDDINQEFEFPDRIKNELITEITGLSGLSNFELATVIPGKEETA